MSASAGTSVPRPPGTLEEPQVQAMFDRIARLYDRMNSVMTAGLHHVWRRRAADLAALAPGDRALDVATGTGDLALELATRVAPGGEVIGCDFAERMLELARVKPVADGAAVRFETANALALPYGDGTFAAATVGFGARNFSDLDQGLREMARVVRPGGRVVVLEITQPTRPPLSTFFGLWFDRIVPAIGRVVGRPGCLRVPAELGPPLPGAGGAGGEAGRGRPGGRSLRAHRRRDHRPARGTAAMSSAAVDAVVSAGGVELPGLLGAVEKRMGELVRGHGPVLARHAGETLAAGGKRLRPLLVCLAAGEAALDAPLLIPAAVAVELIHAATLVHDDVLDRADLRRGRPTVVALAGRRAATATGDLLFSRAFAELASAGSAPAVAVLSRACTELARGELLQRADAYRTDVSVERYLERCRLKTGVLFAAACELGALAAGEAPAELGPLRLRDRRRLPDPRRRP